MSVQTITVPGVYDGIPNDLYHSTGITPAPALSSSGAKLILEKSPAHYRHQVLEGERTHSRAFDIGSTTHLMCLEPENFDAAVAVVMATTKDGKRSNGYTSADARAQRDAAYAAGKVPLLPEELEQIRAMRNAVMTHPIARHAFRGGTPERSYFWIDEETGCWLKARLDYEPPHGRYIIDLKTSVSANPADFSRRVWDSGYHISAAHYLDAIGAITGERPPGFYFVVVEKTPPYCVAVIEVDPLALEWGKLQMRRAIRTFARCLETGVWPGYADDRAVKVGLPGFAIRDLEAQHAAGAFFAPDSPDFLSREHAAAYAAQQPMIQKPKD